MLRTASESYLYCGMKIGRTSLGQYRESRFVVRVLVCRTDLIEEVLDDFPEDQRGSLVFECDAPSVLFIGGRVLEMRPTEVGMIFVLVPARVKVRIRVPVVDAEPVVWVLTIPPYCQCR
jgi:hypothetical protein